MSLVPISQKDTGGQDPYTGKIKVSVTHRKQRLKGLSSGKTSCRNIVGKQRRQPGSDHADS